MGGTVEARHADAAGPTACAYLHSGLEENMERAIGETHVGLWIAGEVPGRRAIPSITGFDLGDAMAQQRRRREKQRSDLHDEHVEWKLSRAKRW